MGVLRHRYRRSYNRHEHQYNHRRLSFTTVTALAFLLFASATGLNPTRQLSGGVRKGKEETKGAGGSETLERVMIERRLGGLGSSPPTCRSKCGGCTPCKPVHVPIEPGFSMPLEYYPEAWRCKCGNKLFMP